MMISSRFGYAAFLAFFLVASTWAYSSFGVSTRRSTMTMKRGRGSFKKESSGSGVQPMGDGAGAEASSSSSGWVPVAGLKSMSELPQEEGKVKLVDTMAKVLKNAATNPTGAVSVVRYGGNTYCFSSSCPSCKIPLTKAKVTAGNEETNGNPKIVCDFCSAAYNLRTGEKLANEGGKGIFGGIAKAVFSSQSSGNLPTYNLGEQNGKVLINLG